MAALRVAKAADEQIRIIAAWWSEHRPASPSLFVTELADALELLMTTPGIGTAYLGSGAITIHRLLLRRSRYHVYFSYDGVADLVEVRAVWHASRGSGPTLE